MENIILENKIRSMVQECIGEIMLERAIRDIVEESVLLEKKSKKKKRGSKSGKKNKSAKSSKKASVKRQGEFRDMLKDPKIDLAQVGYAVEKKGNRDTIRSKWSKKARGERPFTSTEISKGIQAIRQMQN